MPRGFLFGRRTALHLERSSFRFLVQTKNLGWRNCAYCGKPLSESDCTIRRQFPKVAGKPEVGWHASDALGCVSADQLYGRFPAADAIALIGQLQMIEVRGRGRLVANKEWERLNAER